MKKIVFTFSLLLMTIALQAQVLIDDTDSGSTTVEPGAVMELKSNDKGLLLPRLTTEAIDGMEAVEGMLVYDTDAGCFKGHDGVEWQPIGDCNPPTATGPIQDFDSNQSWSYTTSTPACTSGDDVWDITSDLSSINLDNNFWGVADLNGDCGGSDYEDLTFETVNVTGQTVVRFDYDVIGFDSGDNVKYQVTFDGTAQPEVFLITGANNGGTTDAGTVTINIPSSTSTVALKLMVKQNGGGDYAGFDNFRVE